MSNLGVDIILGDEMRAASTIGDALTGRPVTASAITDAAITVGSDLLMFVPGLGAAAVAAKAGRAARAATRGAKALTRAEKAGTAARTMKLNRVAAEKFPGMRATTPLQRKVEQNLTAVARKQRDKATKFARQAGIEENPTQTRFATAKKKAQDQRATAKRKRNSPMRKKLRYTGHVSSDTANLQQIARAYDKKEEDA